MSISAKIICDSISPQRVRLTTLELCYPRFIHSEVMTHRMFSRNASSSRAIPIEKLIRDIRFNPAVPIHWGKNKPGMQAREELEGVNKMKAEKVWLDFVEYTTYRAEVLNDLGLHKQITNRVLEPYSHIKVIVTATEWDNFFNLRLHPDAQPEIQELARCMKEAMEASTPVELKPGEWHMPYVENEGTLVMSCYSNKQELLKDMIKCSVARCARVSYNNHDNSSPDIEKDIALADRLLEAGHMSPLEHQATPMDVTGIHHKLSTYSPWEKGITHMDRSGSFWSGNFMGWIQYRQLINNCN